MGVAAAGLAGLLLLFLPAEAWAWGPSTHVFLASGILGDLAAIPLPLRDLLAAYPYEFLYGNLSADITLAKRYVHYSRHCHRWEMGFALLERGESPRLKSFALGYLSHLAADTLAHNQFVPRQLLVTSSTANVGHAYWEFRFDSHLASDYLKLAREVVGRDHGAPDELLETVLTQPIFSFRTNKRIFRRMIHLSNDERWQSLFVKMVAQSRWDLGEEEVRRYLEIARHYVIDFLNRGTGSLPCRLDPIGRENLDLAKRIRRRTIRDARRDSGRLLDLGKHPEDLAAVADILFGLPAPPQAGGGSSGVAPGPGREALDSFEPGREALDGFEPRQAAGADFWDRFAGLELRPAGTSPDPPSSPAADRAAPAAALLLPGGWPSPGSSSSLHR